MSKCVVACCSQDDVPSPVKLAIWANIAMAGIIDDKELVWPGML